MCIRKSIQRRNCYQIFDNHHSDNEELEKNTTKKMNARRILMTHFVYVIMTQEHFSQFLSII